MPSPAIARMLCLSALISAGSFSYAQQAPASAPSILHPSALSADSSYIGPRYGLDAGPGVELGYGDVPPVPPGMLMRSAPNDPAMVYFALRHRTGTGISPSDASLIDSRQADLVQAAAYRGYDLRRSGWMYQQTVCPAMQGDDASGGSLLLHFVRQEDGRLSSFSAIVPRDENAPVRTIAIAHNSMEQKQGFLSVQTTGKVVNAAIPPAILYASLQPNGGWMATGACIAEMGGAYPHIPNEPSLSNDLLLAPAPVLRLGLRGDREVRLTDRVDATHYVVWRESISKRGTMQSAGRKQFKTLMAASIYPKQPPMRLMPEGKTPRAVVKPYPPGPVPAEAE